MIARRSAPVLVAAVAGLAMATVSAKQSTEAQASITLPNGATVRVEIADTDATRARGLMFRNALALDEGMLFLFDEPGLHAFWMKNTLISLDIIWLDDDGRIVSIAHAVAPCKADPCSHYSPSAKACAVLEVRSGLVTLHEVKVGDTVKLDGLKTGSRCRAQDAKTRCPIAFGRKPPATDGVPCVLRATPVEQWTCYIPKSERKYTPSAVRARNRECTSASNSSEHIARSRDKNRVA